MVPCYLPDGIYIGLILSVQLIKRAGDMFRSNSLPEFLGQRFDSDFIGNCLHGGRTFLVGVIGYAACWLVIGWQNPFGAAGACVIVASIVMIVVSLFTKPMPEETLNKIFAPTRK